MIWNAFLIALREIRRNLTRAFLTVLGVIIGVASVVSLVTLGNGATASIQMQVASLGDNLLMVRPGAAYGARAAPAGVPLFSESDALAIREQVGGVAAVAPIRTAVLSTVTPQNARYTTVSGTTSEFFTINRWILSDGRLFSDTDQRTGAAVCVLGDTVRKDLFGNLDPVGARIRIGSVSCEVIGVLAPKGSVLGMADQNDLIVVPLATIQRRLAGRASVRNVNQINISARNSNDLPSVIADVSLLLRQRRNLQSNQDDNFNIFDTRQIAAQLGSTTMILTMLMGAVAAVSLIVGGIGIMNIMLVSVTERTREIGIRLSIGATAHEVQLQFLIEAVTLSCVGGIIGIVFSFGFCAGLCHLLQVPFLLNPQINVIAFAFSAVVGIAFGFAPARRAAALDPIAALRRE